MSAYPSPRPSFLARVRARRRGAALGRGARVQIPGGVLTWRVLTRPALAWRALAGAALLAAPVSAAAQSAPRLAPDAVCQWGGLGAERVLLCPAYDREGRRVYRIVERRPAAPARRAVSDDPFAAAATRPTGPAPVGRDGRPVAFAPRVGGSADLSAAGDPVRIQPSGRVGASAGLGDGRIQPRIGVGVGFPSGRVSLGAGARTQIYRGISIGGGVSVPLGRF